MTTKVVLTALHGLKPDQQFVFDSPACWVLGRADDCNLQVPDDAAHRSVSRHHCLLAIDPPYISVRDLGSRNGTYVNAVRIGGRLLGQTRPELEAQPQEARRLEEGDAIQTGNVLLTVKVLEEVEAPMQGELMEALG